MSTSDEILGTSTNPAAARVVKIPSPVASPGICILCGKDKHPDGFASAGLDFEFYGTLYLCADCIGDFARPFGWIHPRQAYALARKVDELDKELGIHREALLNLESSVEHLTNYRMLRSAIDGLDSDGSLDSDDSESDEETTESVSGSVINFPVSDSPTESDVSESATEQGSNDVPEPRGDESTDPVTIVEL